MMWKLLKSQIGVKPEYKSFSHWQFRLLWVKTA